MQGTPNSIYDQFGRSVPLEIGFDRRLGGTAATRLTNPIPPMIQYPTMIPGATMQSSFDDIVTKSMLPLPTTQVLMPSGNQPRVAPQPLDQKVEEKTAPPEKPCSGPGGLCPEEANARLFEIFSQKGTGIPCLCGDWDLYEAGKPVESVFRLKLDQEVIVRSNPEVQRDQAFTKTQDVELAFTRWGPAKGTQAPKLLLLHDVLDCRKAWWCAQESLAPFVETIAIDLLGSGDSGKPRGLNQATEMAGIADPFPWSFEAHAQYLLEVTTSVWPTQQFFVAGVGWGAQIAAVMATLDSQIVSGVVLINPPGLAPEIHPEVAYDEIVNLGKIKSELDLENSGHSVLGIVRRSLLESLVPSGSLGSGRSDVSETILKLVLEQYRDLDRQMILIEQISRSGKLGPVELPRTAENDGGIENHKLKCPVLVVSCAQDHIYPAEHRNFYPAIYYNASVATKMIPDGGHLLHLEKPCVVTEIILDFVRREVGFDALGDAFIGKDGSTQGHERAVVQGLRELYKF